MKLVVAEKPSVAMSLAKVLGINKRFDGYLMGNGYIVSWCVGHLVELSNPQNYNPKYEKWKREDLPIIPSDWKYQVSKSTEKQFETLNELMNRKDVDSLICATDAGREGELIFRLVYQKAGCKKPVYRLWISSMEDSAIRKGFDNLKPSSEYDALYKAALCRERADWIVGINATRLFSCVYGVTMNIGRVMTPTLAMVVMRDSAIKGFKSEPYYTVNIKLKDFSLNGERMKEKEKAMDIADKCRTYGKVRILNTVKTEKSEQAPHLYDLTSLQREANRLFGFTAQQTLNYTQSLYEKKLCTYPRTDSRFLTEEIGNTLPELAEKIQNAFNIFSQIPLSVNALQVINPSKVKDHHAIIPTETALNFDYSSLPQGEHLILDMIAKRLVIAVSGPYKYMETLISAECGGSLFKAKGIKTLSKGWREFIPLEENEDKNLPYFSDSTDLEITEVVLKEGQTAPPKRFTEDLLLQAMENAGGDENSEIKRKGIGTPATRAGIIEKLVQKGYLERKGDKAKKQLYSTEKGQTLITVVPEQIQSSSMTAEWEEKLSLIEQGEYSENEFMEEISDMVLDLATNYQPVMDAGVIINPSEKIIGNCPACGYPVKETAKGWFCKNKKCEFVLWKNNNFLKKLGKEMTPYVAESLIKRGNAYLSGCRSNRTGKLYDADLILSTDNDGNTKFSLDFRRE